MSDEVTTEETAIPDGDITSGDVNHAIRKVLYGGQSIQQGSRKLTRADLAQLREMKRAAELADAAANPSDLMGDTFAVYFEGR